MFEPELPHYRAAYRRTSRWLIHVVWTGLLGVFLLGMLIPYGVAYWVAGTYLALSLVIFLGIELKLIALVWRDARERRGLVRPKSMGAPPQE